jgi:hypothetical protein
MCPALWSRMSGMAAFVTMITPNSVNRKDIEFEVEIFASANGIRLNTLSVNTRSDTVRNTFPLETLYYLGDYSCEEVERLDMPLGTVKTYLHRAKRLLPEILTRRPEHGGAE